MTACLRFAARRAMSLIWRALLLGAGIVFAVNVLVLANDAANPVSRIFEPLAIEIPDFCAGADPVIGYARVIREPVAGTFVTYYDTPRRDGFPILHQAAAGMIQYRPRASIWAYPRLSAFMGRPPALEPGQYVAVVTWTFYRPWHSPQSVELVSNVFTVKECE